MARKRIEGRKNSVMQASWELLDTLGLMGKHNESYEDIIWRLIKEHNDGVSK